jgi:hypothetical protein
MIDEKQTQYEYKCQKKTRAYILVTLWAELALCSTAKQPPGQNVAELKMYCRLPTMSKFR